MENTWFIFEGDEGIDAIFDEEINKGKKHKRDDTLVPFKTKIDKNLYEDFLGVVGAFSRLFSKTTIKKGVDLETVKKIMRTKVSNCTDEEFNTLFHIVENVYFEKGKLLPINTKALKYVESNITQQQVAEFLFSLFADSDEFKSQYESMQMSEDTNVLEKLLFEVLDEEENKPVTVAERANCFLPYVKEVFEKDFSVLLSSTTLYQKYIERFLAYYYMFYVSQLAVKLSKFENGKRDEIEQIYMTLYEEIVTRHRRGYEYGWKYVKEKISHMFSHSVLLEMMSYNSEALHTDYLGFYERFNMSDDDGKVAEEIRCIDEKYKQWIVMDYSICKYSDNDSNCKTSKEMRRLFETIDFQFINGGRKSHYNGYNKKFIDFVQKNFGKFRGMNGYTLSLRESDVIMFTHIVVKINGSKMQLSKVFTELEKRGLIFDRESKKHIVELYEKMNLLEKRSDSGEAQYVKCIL